MKSLFILNTIIAIVSGAILSFLSNYPIMFVATFGICYWGLIIGVLADKIINITNPSPTSSKSLKVSHAKV